MRFSLIFVQAIAIVILIAALATRAQSPGEPTMADRSAAHRLLITTKAMDLSSQAIDAIFEQYAEALPQVNNKTWMDLRLEFDTSELAPAMEDIYMRYFTEQELNGIADFYESPLGKLYVETQSSLLDESMAAGKVWAQGINARMRSRLEDKKLLQPL